MVEALGGRVVQYRGMKKCCGYPIVSDNERASNAMVANHTLEAKEMGAQVMVTPCPLCHMNLDGTQPQAAQQRDTKIGMPIFHLPQLVGLALGMDASELGLSRHTVPAGELLAQIKA